MFDIFTKSKVEPAIKAPVSEPDRPSGLDDAWRIAHAIDRALKTAESERNTLAGRVEDATAWSAVSLGNGDDEYLEREQLDTMHLNLFDDQIREGNKRTSRLDQDIACYKHLKAALLAGFPELTRKEFQS